MRWTPGGVSGDIEDRRASSGGPPIRGVHLGLGGTLILIVLSLIFRRDFVSMFTGEAGPSPAANQASRSAPESPEEAKMVQFVSFVLDDAQNTWERILPQQAGTPYRHAKLVLFRDATPSACGMA